MPKVKMLWNASKLQMEPAIVKQCPRCRGFGAVRGDEKSCPICNGFGDAWVTESGWTLPKYKKSDEAVLY